MIQLNSPPSHFLETKFHYVALTSLELSTEQAGLNTEICQSLPSKCWD